MIDHESVKQGDLLLWQHGDDEIDLVIVVNRFEGQNGYDQNTWSCFIIYSTATLMKKRDLFIIDKGNSVWWTRVGE